MRVRLRASTLVALTATMLSLPACDREAPPGSAGPTTVSPEVAEEPSPAPSPSTSPSYRLDTLGCPVGSTPDEPGPADQARPSSASWMPMAFDRDSGRIVLLLQRAGHGALSTWTFDVCINSWRRMSPAEEPVGGRASGPIVYDEDSDLTITMLEGGSIWAYDVESDTWTRKGDAPFSDQSSTVRMAYDRGTGLVWVRAEGLTARPGLWTYDVDADTWAEVDQEVRPWLGAADHQLLVFDPSTDRLVGFASRLVPWTFDPGTGRWSSMSASTPVFNTGYFASGGEAAYDEAAKRTVVFSDGFIGAYDAARDRWDRLTRSTSDGGEGTFRLLGHWMVYDPLNRRLVVYGGARIGPDGARRIDGVWAFEVESRTWINLLAPSEEV